MIDIAVMEKLENKVNILKALAHTTRLFIVEELNKKELCVNEITDMVGVDISTISKHLSVLKNAKIIKDKKVGNCVYYSLIAPCILDMFDCINDVSPVPVCTCKTK